MMSYVKEDVILQLEQSKVTSVLKLREGAVEEVVCDGGHHGAEEDLPGQLEVPE